MKRLLGTMIAAAMLTAGAGAFAQDTEKPKGRIETRKDKQQKRIADGTAEGSLTPGETAKIEAKEAKLNREIRKDRRDGGGLTAKERVKIEKKQDRLSRQIAKEKHDAQHKK